MLDQEELAIFELAFHTGYKVNYIKHEMSFEEFLKWQEYFKARPIDWRDDDRTMKFLQTQGVKARPREIFQSIASLEDYENSRKSIFANFKNSLFFSKMSTAIGGDKLDIFKETE